MSEEMMKAEGITTPQSPTATAPLTQASAPEIANAISASPTANLPKDKICLRGSLEGGEMAVSRTPEVVAAEIRALTANMLTSIVEIGRRMCEAKEMLPHGSFGNWIKENTGYSVPCIHTSVIAAPSEPPAFNVYASSLFVNLS